MDITPELARIFSYRIPLAQLTTLEVGGPCRVLARPANDQEVRACLQWAHEQQLPIYALGGGSNTLADDEGFEGMILQHSGNGIEIVESQPERVLVQAQAGTVWDDLVAFTVEHDLAGLECLSGIPGRVGASPVQNVGAYGQEIANVFSSARALEMATGREVLFQREECGFAYRLSNFKSIWRNKYIITAVTFQLVPHGRPLIRYGDLTRRLTEEMGLTPEEAQNANYGNPTLAHVRRLILDIRRGKSMTPAPDDPNRRSAGSFFTNPIVPSAQADLLLAEYPDMPKYAAAPGYTKLAAAWLLEHAGCQKGYRKGGAGISSRHVLALINADGATAADIKALSAEMVAKVQEKFAITLVPEPNLLS